MTILLQDRACERLPAYHENRLAIFLQLIDKRNKIAISADDGERIHVIVGEGHLQRVESEIDVRSILISAGRRQPLYHLNGVFRHLPGCAFLAAPVCVSELGYDIAALLECVKRERYVELAP